MRDRPSASEILAWSLVGLAAGLAAGVTLGAWLGPVDRPRMRRTVSRLRQPAPDRLSPGEAARAVRQALSRDPALREFALQPVSVGPGVVELHGWVPNRSVRARAARFAAAVEGVDSLVNCLLVHGEDDEPLSDLDATDQPA
jgi:hypothetical protein